MNHISCNREIAKLQARLDAVDEAAWDKLKAELEEAKEIGLKVHGELNEYIAKCHDQAAEIERLREALDDILNYWNQDRNDEAMFNALDVIEKIADEALKGKNDDKNRTAISETNPQTSSQTGELKSILRP